MVPSGPHLWQVPLPWKQHHRDAGEACLRTSISQSSALQLTLKPCGFYLLNISRISPSSPPPRAPTYLTLAPAWTTTWGPFLQITPLPCFYPAETSRISSKSSSDLTSPSLHLSRDVLGEGRVLCVPYLGALHTQLFPPIPRARLTHRHTRRPCAHRLTSLHLPTCYSSGCICFFPFLPKSCFPLLPLLRKLSSSLGAPGAKVHGLGSYTTAVHSLPAPGAASLGSGYYRQPPSGACENKSAPGLHASSWWPRVAFRGFKGALLDLCCHLLKMLCVCLWTNVLFLWGLQSERMRPSLLPYDPFLPFLATSAATLFPNTVTFGDTGGRTPAHGVGEAREQSSPCRELTPGLSGRADGLVGDAPRTVFLPACERLPVVVMAHRLVRFLVSSLSPSRLLSNWSCVYFC